jgi:hypothetical protein
MIDSSALLLAIVMTTPAEYLDDHNNNNNFVSFNSLGDIMQRLCWPHTHTMNMECEAKISPTTTYHQVSSDQKLAKALNKALYTFRLKQRKRDRSLHQ